MRNVIDLLLMPIWIFLAFLIALGEAAEWVGDTLNEWLHPRRGL